MAVAVQRPLKGSRISSFYPVKDLPSLASLDSAFQLQEYISLLIHLDPHDVDKIVSVPGKTNGKERELSNGSEEDVRGEDREGKSEITVDEACWIYEQLRRLAQDLTHPLITMLQAECTRATCPEMKAGEWLYLCVAHGNDGAMEQCCAIDYIVHTLDSATALLNSPRAFPSRLSIPQTSHRHFSSLARRLGRIFAHAYFHHREAFEQAEAESSLYARFLALTSKFDLVPPEFLVIPSRMNNVTAEDVEPPRLLGAAVDPAKTGGGLANSELGLRPDQDVGEMVQRGAYHLGPGVLFGAGARTSSPPGPAAGLSRGESPRKLGRNRTDTMVYSEAQNMAEELAREMGERLTIAGGEGESENEQRGREGSTVVDQEEKIVEVHESPQPAPEPTTGSMSASVVDLSESESTDAPDPVDTSSAAPSGVDEVEVDKTITELGQDETFIMLAPPAESCAVDDRENIMESPPEREGQPEVQVPEEVKEADEAGAGMEIEREEEREKEKETEETLDADMAPPPDESTVEGVPTDAVAEDAVEDRQIEIKTPAQPEVDAPQTDEVAPEGKEESF